MSTKSSVTGGVLSSPKGGGSLQGIGEKFSPDLFTGTGNFTVPIAVPPGRNGFQPQLSLSYSTGQGQGPFGLGWSLSVPGVTRKTSRGIPIYDDSRDVFLLSGAEDLVPVDGGAPPAQRYRPRTEGLFARISHVRSPQTADDYWEVRTKDGLVSHYGTAAAAGADPATLVDPDHPHRTFAWRLSHTHDPFGNRIEYAYTSDRVVGDGRNGVQLYLSEIRYIDYGQGQFLARVLLRYEEGPPEGSHSDYRAGFEIRTRRRCTAIETHTTTKVRTLHLEYADQLGLPTARNGAWLLARVRVEGHDGDASQELPPLAFDHTRFEPEGRKFFAVRGEQLPVESLAHPDYEMADLFGSGLPDIFQMNGVSARYWRNLGEGRFDRPRAMSDAPAGYRLGDPSVQLLDADGDGRLDLLIDTPATSGFFSLGATGWDHRSFRPYAQAPSFDLTDPEVKLLDLDGDGVTDALRTGARLESFFNDPHRGWDRTHQAERGPLADFPDVSFSDPRVRVADLSGDGLQDILLLHDGLIEYWPNLGRGRWGKRVKMRASPRFPWGYDPKRILVGDVDGDGAADVLYVADGRVTLWINQAGNGFAEPIVIEGTPPVTDMDAVRLVDLLGNGVAGLLWSTDADGMRKDRMFFLDFTGGVKPYVLEAMDNHLGALTRVHYAPSTRFYLADRRTPDRHWKTTLPFPVQVVSRVEVIDQVSQGKLTTEYGYHHGYWDGGEREFRGFGRVDQHDTEVFDRYHAEGLHADRPFVPVQTEHFSQPTETRTWFHLGPVGPEVGGWQEIDLGSEYWEGDPPAFEPPADREALFKLLPRRARRDAVRTLRGQMLRSELYALDGTWLEKRPYTVSEHVSSVREEPSPPGASHRIFFPFAHAERATQWERGTEPMHRFTFSGDYDPYGQPRTQTAVAVPRRRDFRVPAPPGAPYLATHTRTRRAVRDDAGRYIVDRVAEVASYEVRNDGSPTLAGLLDRVTRGTTDLSPIGHSFQYYDGPAFEGLPNGQIGDFGALMSSENLVATDAILQAAYGAAPLYLANPPASWTDEYPLDFRARLAPGAGYRRRDDRLFAVSARRRYGPRGLVTVKRDPLGNDTLIAYDPTYDLLPVTVTDPMGLVTRAAYDLRVLQPRELTDPNGNRTTYAYSPLNLVESIAVAGKENEGLGDPPDQPSTRFVYDLTAFAKRGQPISVRTIRRVRHATEVGIPQPARGEMLESHEYSDGFGRLLQTRSQGEELIYGDPRLGRLDMAESAVGVPAGPKGRVVVSGWQTYDNKGRVVEKYEPFFDDGWEFAPGQHGAKATLCYDPRGQVIRTVNPDGSEQRVLYGIPEALDRPELLQPTPWEAYTYDPNDNAGRTHPKGAASYQSHWNTPASIEVDALGRTVRADERTSADPKVAPFTTRSTYDVRGNLLTVVDALGRTAFQYAYDLANRPLRTESLDGGVKTTVLDAAGNPVEQRDAKGALTLHAYDVLHRPVRLWARDNPKESMTLRERLVHDGAGLQDPAEANLLGRPYQHYDEAGLLTFARYDFRGNMVEKRRQVIADGPLLSVFGRADRDGVVPPYRVEWDPLDASILDGTVYETTTSYDALGRVTLLRYPADVRGDRQKLEPRYNRAGALERVTLEGEVHVEHIAYNPKGQRTLVAYGNGILTRLSYNEETFRLEQMTTEHAEHPAPDTYRPTGNVLQDYAYSYDLAGNVLAIDDATPEYGPPRREFTYDPLYRLLQGNGRESDVPERPPWDAEPKPSDPAKTRNYTENYTYDPVGNLMELGHVAQPGAFVRQFTLAGKTNRLATMTSGQTVYPYTYDAAGNMTSETLSRHFEWDHADRMRVFRNQPEPAAPTVHAQYLYDASGQRTKKLVRKQGSVEVTVYVDGHFEHHLGDVENNTLHVMDNAQRVALVRVGPPLPGDATPTVKYQLGDHLGSANVVVDAGGGFVNREEFTPYGETSFGGYARKSYRFTGQERDEESGLSYHSARYYASWLLRWSAIDPAGFRGNNGINSYYYSRDNPMSYVDMSGREEGLSEKVSGTIQRHMGPIVATTEQALSMAPLVDNLAQPAVDTVKGAIAGAAEASYSPVAVQLVPDRRSPEFQRGEAVGQFAIAVFLMFMGAPMAGGAGAGGVSVGGVAGGTGVLQLVPAGAAATIGAAVQGLGVVGVLGGIKTLMTSGGSSKPPSTSGAESTAPKGAYETAKSGGKHSGFLKNYQGRSSEEIRKGISSIEKQVAEHQAKIADPASKIKDWDLLDPRQQQALVNKKWPDDIARQQEQIDVLKGLLLSRG